MSDELHTCGWCDNLDEKCQCLPPTPPNRISSSELVSRLYEKYRAADAERVTAREACEVARSAHDAAEQQEYMGYIKHNAIIVTSWKPGMVEQTRAKAEELGMVVSAVAKSRVNGYSSILVAPDGSKEGWEDSAAGDAKRAALRAWLNSQKYEDGSSSMEWCEVSYGSDDQIAKVVTHGWAK